jgi:hypothetical protein
MRDSASCIYTSNAIICVFILISDKFNAGPQRWKTKDHFGV